MPVKSKVAISQNFVAFSEYMNFMWLMGNDIWTSVLVKSICFDFFSSYVGISVIKTRTSNGSEDITH